MMLRAIIGTISFMFLNNLGLTLAINNTGLLRVIGFIDYLATGLILLFVVNVYMNSDFFKNLNKTTSWKDPQ